ncbi:facilitated trehalose transporter Tret1-like [Hyposmocoma kahamanoa]|uniref:facilitated trehalose transporter Tret1-like n=1 Tax=Hyposmocoma kahamanoa TaxID=1477025 RepID=UPI000E6D7B09|nr:facilitated trehalose transporter Tret1-like [Hyposmocoma kahamanoa]
MGSLGSWAAQVLPKFHDNQTAFELSKNEISWMVSMSPPGYMCGSLATRYLADSFGRRASLLGSVVPVAFGTGIAAFATKAWLLYLTRFLWGFATGMNGSIIGLYLAEIADKDIRGSTALITKFMYNFGILLMMCIGPSVSYTTLNYILLVLPISYFTVNLWIPESPYYCLMQGKVDAAKNVLKRIRSKNEKIVVDQLLQMQIDVKNEMRHSSTAKELFSSKRYRKAIIIIAGLKLTQIMAGQFLIHQYLGLIIKESRFEMALPTLFIIFGVVRFVAGIMSSFLVDRIDRRPLLIYSFLTSGICMIVMGIYFFLLEVVKVDSDEITSYGFIPFVCIVSSNVVSTLGFNSVIGIIQAEIFALNIKAVALASLCIFGGLLNFIVTRSYQIFLDLTGLCGVFWILGLFGISGSIFSLFVVPETRGKSLRQIQITLQGDLYEIDGASVQLNIPEGNKYEGVNELIKKDPSLL